MTEAESRTAAQPVNNDIDPKVVSRLPRIPKAVRFQDARVLGHGVHSEVYSVTATYKNRTITAALKFFSGRWKERFEAEVQAYEFLEHNSLYGIVPIAFGCGRDWDTQRVRDVLGNALAQTSSLQTPVSVIMLEYIPESAQLSVDNIDWKVCEQVLRGLDLIHSSQVLHHDIGERNVLVVPTTGRVVWIDFSSSYINPSEMEKWREREVAYSILYQEVVSCLRHRVLIYSCPNDSLMNPKIPFRHEHQPMQKKMSTLLYREFLVFLRERYWLWYFQAMLTTQAGSHGIHISSHS